MPNRLRQFIEKLAFAGLKPDAPMAPKKSRLKALMDFAEDFAARGLKAEDEPLAGPMSLRRKIAIGIAVLAMAATAAGLVVVLHRPADRPERAAASGPPPPIVPPGFHVDKNQDLGVGEIEFNRGKEPKEITGTLRNLTDRRFASCDVSFDVTTKAGAQLGGVATTIHDLAPHASARFRIPVPQKEAGFAMVRELRHE